MNTRERAEKILLAKFPLLSAKSNKEGMERIIDVMIEFASLPVMRDDLYLKTQPIIIEKYADNGEHSHWDLINTETGDILWSENNLQQSIMTDEEIIELKLIRNYFGEHDKTIFEHHAYTVINNFLSRFQPFGKNEHLEKGNDFYD